MASGEPARFFDVLADLCQTHDISPTANQRRIDIGADDDSTGVIESAPAVRYARIHHAVQLAVARLVAQGVIVEVELDRSGPPQQRIQVPYRFSEGSSGREGYIDISVSMIKVPGAFQLTPGVIAAGDVPLLTTQKWEDDIAPLLTDRLPQILSEALNSFRRGQYLSATTLLGSMVEGGWTRAGEMLRGHSTQLDTALDNDRTADVQKRMHEVLKEAKNRQADDLHTFATFIRGIRNYGIHPNAAENRAAEEAQSELGCFTLLQRVHAHLLTLLDAVQNLRATTP